MRLRVRKCFHLDESFFFVHCGLYLFFYPANIKSSLRSHIRFISFLYFQATVYVKVLKFLEEQKMTPTKYGIKTTRTAVIADNTKAVKITLWQNSVEAVEEDKYYKLANIITNLFNNEVWINTTADTKISEIDPYEGVQDGAELLQPSTSQIELATVSVVQNLKCSNMKCSKAINLDTVNQDPTMRCPHCAMKQKTANMRKTTTVQMNTKTQSYYMDDLAIEDFLKKEKEIDLLQDTDRLEDFLLEIEKFTVGFKHNTNYIISISRC